MSTESDDARLVRIETALIGIDRQGGLVADMKNLTQTVTGNAKAAAESRALIHGRIDRVDRKATRAAWWSKLPTVTLVALGAIAGVWKAFLDH